MGPTQFQIPNPGGFMSAVNLLNQPLNERVFDPKIYLSATHEVFGFTLIITWIITLIYRPEQIFNHPARSIIGSFNPTFGWDYPPASYIALVCCSLNVYLTWRYAWLERTRITLSNPGKLTWYEHFLSYACIQLAFASNGWLLMWLIGPASIGAWREVTLTPVAMPAWYIHSGLFVFYVVALYLACLANYLESRFGGRGGEMRRKHTVFICVYGSAVTAIVGLYGFNLARYKSYVHSRPDRSVKR